MLLCPYVILLPSATAAVSETPQAVLLPAQSVQESAALRAWPLICPLNLQLPSGTAFREQGLKFGLKLELCNSAA